MSVASSDFKSHVTFFAALIGCLQVSSVHMHTQLKFYNLLRLKRVRAHICVESKLNIHVTYDTHAVQTAKVKCLHMLAAIVEWTCSFGRW